MVVTDQVQFCHAERSEESDVPISQRFFAALGMTEPIREIADAIHRVKRSINVV